MKLYTEEQVLKAIREARYYIDLIKPDNVILKELTPIELPSDEEIAKKSHYKVSNNTKTPNWYFIEGAKWMKEQILNQNKWGIKVDATKSQVTTTDVWSPKTN